MWLGATVMVGGLVVECAAMIGIKYFGIGRCLQWQSLGFILFLVGAVLLSAADRCP
jgi:hypothetical protein